MILEAYAKINWSLDITGLREDGYHFMDMLMQPVSLSDEISLTPSSALSITTSEYSSKELILKLKRQHFGQVM